MGVSLLERGCIREAIQAFTNSISFMKRSMMMTTESSSKENSRIDDFGMHVDKTLRKTAALLVHQVHHPATNSSIGEKQVNTTNIHPLDDQDDLSEAAFAHGSLSLSPYPCFPIRLRSSSHHHHHNPAVAAGQQQQQQQQQQIEVPAAIILYNLGLANMLLACSSRKDGQFFNEKYGTRMLNCAYKSLSLSQCILIQQQQVSSCKNNDDIYPDCLRLKQVSALVLQCLFRIYHWTCQTHQADQVLATLTRLVHEGRESEVILQNLNVEKTGKHTMAPAA